MFVYCHSAKEVVQRCVAQFDSVVKLIKGRQPNIFLIRGAAHF
ncbi:hypothetical protein H206_05315 [Candidatus Electrothrix aarhusensis]|uniref:Uncharacterized protein n=1 Tax=Candidatus Electrothrix aarhusensis TaxID=1859131 RepID=A0A3S3RAK9_9BACT|nr:hypothetical protein H206_05315 [Candidatus Electrothrix aarhusensis]